MIFFDTNVQVYSTVNQDKDKQRISGGLIETAIKENIFSISPLVLSEFIYVLAKLKIDKALVDFDKDFTQFKKSSNIVIEVLETIKKGRRGIHLILNRASPGSVR